MAVNATAIDAPLTLWTAKTHGPVLAFSTNSPRMSTTATPPEADVAEANSRSVEPMRTEPVPAETDAP